MVTQRANVHDHSNPNQIKPSKAKVEQDNEEKEKKERFLLGNAFYKYYELIL